MVDLVYKKQGLSAPEQVQAHSTRGVAVFWTAYANILVEDNCRTASWSLCANFVWHYKLDVLSVSSVTFGTVVVSATLQEK